MSSDPLVLSNNSDLLKAFVQLDIKEEGEVKENEKVPEVSKDLIKLSETPNKEPTEEKFVKEEPLDIEQTLPNIEEILNKDDTSDCNHDLPQEATPYFTPNGTPEGTTDGSQEGSQERTRVVTSEKSEDDPNRPPIPPPKRATQNERIHGKHHFKATEISSTVSEGKRQSDIMYESQHKPKKNRSGAIITSKDQRDRRREKQRQRRYRNRLRRREQRLQSERGFRRHAESISAFKIGRLTDRKPFDAMISALEKKDKEKKNDQKLLAEESEGSGKSKKLINATKVDMIRKQLTSNLKKPDDEDDDDSEDESIENVIRPVKRSVRTYANLSQHPLFRKNTEY
ncbi:hypothetical protein SNEBB_008969 [Seison nebaliae]|nr:hypothetical protein SNEBB_008969 [Seison nebaliae]